MASVSSVQGIVSGIKWQDIVDQLATINSTRDLDPITARITANQTKSAAWANYRTLAQNLSDAAKGLKDGTALTTLQVSGGTSPSSGRSLFSATASANATPGSYQVEVLGLAQAEKLSGSAVASTTAALGFSGDVAVNGRKISIAVTDSLSTIRDALNAANLGTNATGVTATILSTATGASRLVLTSDTLGARGVQLVDSAASNGVLQQLGLLDGSYEIPTDSSGSSISGTFSAADTSIASTLGLSAPAATTIRVGNLSIAVDLGTDSLADIATRIQTAGIGARVTSTNGVSQLVIDANISAAPSPDDASVSDANSLRALQLLGFAHGGKSAVSQQYASGALLDAGSAPATAATLLSDVNANGTNANIQAGDTVSVTGRRGDGTAVSLSYVVGAGATLNDLLTRINGAGGFGSGTRTATATIGADGAIHLTDSAGGDSQLSISLGVAKSVANGGGATGLGAFHAETVGRLREVVAGSDAQLRVDGVLLTRTSNTISNAIDGVTLRLQQSEVGTSAALAVSRDTSSAVASAGVFAKAYNDLIAYVGSATAAGGDLANNGSLRSSAHALTQALLTDVTGASLTRPVLAGISLDKTGVLKVDSAALTAALKANANSVRDLFALGGSVTGSSLEYIGAGDLTQAGTYSVNITAIATKPSVAGTGATWPFNDGGVARTLTLGDGSSARSGSISLATGDDATTIASKLNAMFTTKGMLMSASVVSGLLTIGGTQYGSASTFSVAYGAGDTTSAAQLGIAAGSFAGSDVQGTIDGVAAIGSGQLLTSAPATPTEGLAVRYFGSTPGVVGSAKVIVGTGALVSRLASFITSGGDGLVDSITTALDIATTKLQQRSADVSARLARQKDTMLAQFQAMETAIGKLQAQGSQISSMIAALTASQSTSN
ncbi:MAG: Flagellar hook-associated protein 2 [Gemmatimonadetes bacterium]|nr:Flagellar hook-associated protein 2 [Gemmatimonadota bacterium]